MRKYKITKKAVNDLTLIWNYTVDKRSEIQAEKYYQLLLCKSDEIAANPNLGRKYSEVFETLLGLKIGRHIIFYRIIGENEIEITRILHEQMDLKNRTKEK